MRILLLTIPLVLMTGCQKPVERTASVQDLRGRQNAACTAAIAAHINRSILDIRPRWLSETDGIATVETMDGNRRHLCQVDADGHVIGFSHPR
ncbi:hypothetical protein [Paracoccus fistulariae]|uniref:Lipoprotein n=1 Tax=Paracoccus fistulariae TaxID=658446 RepID=A0ABY7SHF3_9RHOB|nr:hypothetical protein [Paracoccus fistulariae]MDB6181149.1 hypothetical protein [Paracoccus fistulariae]WCR06436.1 hypothetical protein JHX87_13180 [Paracoccus fistulariae]